MIIVTKSNVSEPELANIRQRVESLGLKTHITRGSHRVVIACVGDDAAMAEVPLLALAGVESVTPILRPYKLASREFGHPDEPTVVRVAPGVAFGGRAIQVIAGPCSVEGSEMLLDTAVAVRDAGATMLRGGAYKPRTSPYAFQGMGEAALELLAATRAETGLPIVTEVMDTRQVETVCRYADMLQIGARNMQNFALLAEVGRTKKPVLLKRGLSATIKELLMAAEYVMASGNQDVVLCERGIRTFETATRNTLDVAAIPVLKEETHFPVIVDPSHAGGRAALVAPLAFAAIAAGADGLIIEVHPRPEDARSDGDQSLDFAAFAELMTRIGAFAEAAGRTIHVPSHERVISHARIAFQGELGAFSEEAIRNIDRDAMPVPCREFIDVAQAVESGDADAGVLPIENTLAGSVVGSYDALTACASLRVVAETVVEIHHCLMAPSGATLDALATVESHPVALAQCTRWLRAHPSIVVCAAYDTAGAARDVATRGDSRAAAIAARGAAARYDLLILAANIEDRSDNQTRFLLVARKPRALPRDTPARTALLLTTPNVPGALLRVLEPLARHGINMSKLESRPADEPWHYRFFLELDHAAGDPSLDSAIEQLRVVTESLRVLGTYGRWASGRAGSGMTD